jgi:hypothetical protein
MPRVHKCPNCKCEPQTTIKTINAKRRAVKKIGARNYYQPWNEQDDEIAMDTSLTVAERAKKLGRTYYAVINRVYDIKNGYVGDPTREITSLQTYECPTCHTKFRKYVRPAEKARYALGVRPGPFCSRSCASKYRSRNKT